MTDRVEAFDRAKSAIYDALEADPGVQGGDSLALQSGLIFMSGDIHLDPAAIVRAVLQAIHEPDEQTLRAMGATVPTWDDRVNRRKWISAVDAILAQGNKKGAEP